MERHRNALCVRFIRTLATVGLVAGVFIVRSSAQTVAEGPFVAGDVLVKFRPGINANAKADAHRTSGGTPLVEVPRSGVHRVRVTPGQERAAVAGYRRNPNVLYAEPNYVRTIPRPIAHETGAVVPGDYHFAEQWGLDNTGQEFYCIPWPFGGELCFYIGTADADIDAPEAWAILQGSSAITVAVIDSGVDYTHPDLAANYAGGDDFVFGDGDPMDDHGHGTHVAGTIAALMNNPTGTPAESEGVVGVAPNTRIRAYKVCRADGTCDDFAIQQAIARAIADGANIINMSLGEASYSQSLDEAVQDAWNAGLVIVAGAGNDGTTAAFYPAALDNVISVAAFDEDHRRPSFSNYGSWVDISAPGNVIMSTYPVAACSASTTPGDMGCYAWNTGTSMATPHVSGAAALVWSRSDVTGNSQVVSILLNSADPGGVATVRLDSWTIHGGLNLHDAVSYGLTNLPPQADAGADQAVLDKEGDGTELVTLDGTASSDSDGSIVSYDWSEGGSSIGAGASPAVSLSVGVHTLTLEVTDDDGDTATDTVVVTVNVANEVTVAATTAQGNEAGPANGVFTVTRTGDTTAPLTVRYTVGGTAVAGTDYVSLPGAVTIGAGSASASVAVTPIDDAAYENNESVILTLSANAAYRLGSAITGTVTIVSDDLPQDLIVSAMTAPATAGADTDVVVTDTTKNQGTGTSPASSTGFYLSANNTLDSADTWLGSRPVPSLGPGATNAVSTTLHVPLSTGVGSYYVLAKADWDGVVNESVETNNVRASGVIKVGPDLIVSAFTTPATAAAGATISVTDTTKNQGGGPAGASSTRFYWSTNTSFDGADQMLGNRSVGPLAAGASDSLTTTLVVPSTAGAGTYYVLAVSDSANTVPETTENNNRKAGPALKVGPDLVVTAVSVPGTAAAGATISATDTTKNEGSGTAGTSSTGFYLSSNPSIDAADRFIGSRSVGELTGNATAAASTPLVIPPDMPTGNYYVVARADWNASIAETAETNNDRASGLMKIGGDLVVTAMSAPAAWVSSGPLAVTDTTRNQGAAAVPESRTAFYLSVNGNYEPTDQYLGERIVPGLAPSATSTASTQLVMPAGVTPGLYYVIAVADAGGGVTEVLENNNTRNSATMKVGPDLQVPSLSVVGSAVAGSNITVTDTTRNDGDASPGSTTRFYLSSDASFEASDQLLGSRQVSPLGVGLSQGASTSLTIPASTTPGTYYIFAKADADNAIAESIESNNTRARTISITAAPPP